MNYCNLIVKIIKPPVERYFENNIPVVEILVKFSPVKKDKGVDVLNLRVWGNLGHDVMKYYKINDYVIIEGFLSPKKNPSDKHPQISIRKVYPCVLNNSKVNETVYYQK